MSISSISSTISPYSALLQKPASQQGQDLKALSGALQSGDLTSAQQALAAFQNAIQNGSQAQNSKSASNADPFAKDLQTLQSAIQSGDLNGAQQALATLKQDMHSVRKAHGHHHHHPAAAAGGTNTSAGSNSTSTDSTDNTDPSSLSAINLLA